MFRAHHVALSVKDIDASKRFYSFLGFQTALDWISETGHLKISHLALSGFILELFCYVESQENIGTSLEEDLRKNGIKHFGLRVDSIEEAKKQLVSSGVVPEDVEIKLGRTGITYFFVKDPDNIIVEIVQDDRKFDL